MLRSLLSATAGGLLISILATGLAGAAPNTPDDALSPKATPVAAVQTDIVQTAEATGAFKTFVKLIRAAGLDTTLDGKGPYTVFAPTDEAFADLPKARLEQLEQPSHRAELARILSYHIIVGEVTTANMSGRQSVETLEGREIVINATMNAVTLNKTATLVAADIRATNGVIHGIDEVLTPPIKPSYIAKTAD